MASIRLLNQAHHPFQVEPFSSLEVFERGDAFTLQNGYVRAEFDPDGLLQKVTTLDDRQESPVRLSFVRYGTRRSGDKSGAYLFLPDSEAKTVKVEAPKVKVVEGKILSYVEVRLPFCTHVVTLKTSPGKTRALRQRRL